MTENSSSEMNDNILEIEDEFPLLRGKYKISFNSNFNPLLLDLTSLELPTRLKNYLQRRPHLKTLKDLLKVEYNSLLEEPNIGERTLNRFITHVIKHFNFELVNTLILPVDKNISFDPYKNGFLDWLELSKNMLPQRDFIMCLERWGIDSKQKSLADIGISFSLTKERVRQIIQRSIDRIIKVQSKASYDAYILYLLEILITNCRPIEFTDLYNNNLFEFRKIYPDMVYMSFLSEIFPDVAFEGQMMKSFEQRMIRLSPEKDDRVSYYNQLKIIDYPFGIMTIDKLFQNFNLGKDNTKEKLRLLYTVFALNEIKFVRKDSKYFLIRISNLKDMTKDILLGSENAMEVDEIREVINKYYGETSKYNSKISIMGNINRNKDIYLLGQTKFGLIKHFGYQKEDWKNISDASESFLLSLNRQSNAIEILQFIKSSFPNISSKYELVHILRNSDSIVDLGFFNFCHSSLNLEERSKISDIVKKIFTLQERVLHLDEIINHIKEIRFIRTEGMGVLLNGIDYLEYYKGGYYGRKDLHTKNIEELSSNEDYLSNVISKQLYPNTTVEDIKIHFENFDIEKIFQTISNSEKFIIKDINGSGNDLIFVKFWSTYKLLKFLLYNINDGLYKDEINWYFKEMNKSIDEIEPYKLKRYAMKYTDGKYFLDENNFNITDDEDIIEIAYYIVKEASSMLVLDDVYKELREYDNSIMLSKENLAQQLKNDKRFILTDNNLVTLYE